MAAGLRVTPAAEIDIAEAALWYENREPGLGERFLWEIDALLEGIAVEPHRFPEVMAWRRRALMDRFPFGIYFLLTPTDDVVVLAVIHLRRDPDRWRDRVSEHLVLTQA